jgi:hypothetical protein
VRGRAYSAAHFFWVARTATDLDPRQRSVSGAHLRRKAMAERCMAMHFDDTIGALLR